MQNTDSTFKVRDLMVSALPENESETRWSCTAATCTCTPTGWDAPKMLDGDREPLAALQDEMRSVLAN